MPRPLAPCDSHRIARISFARLQLRQEEVKQLLLRAILAEISLHARGIPKVRYRADFPGGHDKGIWHPTKSNTILVMDSVRNYQEEGCVVFAAPLLGTHTHEIGDRTWFSLADFDVYSLHVIHEALLSVPSCS